MLPVKHVRKNKFATTTFVCSLVSFIFLSACSNKSSLRSLSGLSTNPKPAEEVIKPTGIPTGFSNNKKLLAKISGEEIVRYRYAFIKDDKATCATATYSEWIDASNLISEDTGDDGQKKLCVIGRTAISVLDPVEYSWVQDTSVPPKATLADKPIERSTSKDLNIKVTGVDATQYAYAIVPKGTSCSVPDSNTKYSIDTRLSASVQQDGNFTLCVVTFDAAFNKSEPTAIDWTVDSTPPTSTVSGAPVGAANATSVTVNVSSPDAVGYRYGMSTTNCSAVNYSSVTVLSTPISVVLGADGLQVLCLKTIDDFGNESAPEVISWTKDTTPPTVVLSQTPTQPSGVQSLNVLAGPADVQSYKYALVTQTDSCTTATYSVSWIAVATPITDNLGANGNKRLCVIGRDLAGNAQAVADATVFNWTKSTLVTATISQTPSVYLSTFMFLIHKIPTVLPKLILVRGLLLRLISQMPLGPTVQNDYV